MRRERYRVGNDEYRDDRKFVMNLHPCGHGRWALITYRNTGSLPGVRDDEFKSFEEAVAYVKKWEPRVPLISLGEVPMDLDHLQTIEERYQFFLSWLSEKDLFGTLKLYRHCPFWHDERGWTEKKTAVSIKSETLTIDGVQINETVTKPTLSEV